MLLIVLLPVSATALFPHAMMGITGLNPVNLLLAGTLGAYLLRGRLEHPGPLVPQPLLWLYVVPIVLAGLIGTRHVDDIHPGFFEAHGGRITPTWPGYLRDTVVKPLFIVLAAVLVAAAVAKAQQARALHRRDRGRRLPARPRDARLHHRFRGQAGLPRLGARARVLHRDRHARQRRSAACSSPPTR